MNKYFLVIITFILSAVDSSATELSGNIGGMTLKPAGNPYILSDNITIKSNDTLKIQAGCIILFSPFTGIIIEGSLIVKGSLEKPVVFTTINDTSYNPGTVGAPNAFDWNGIYITPQAQKVQIENFILSYSVFGIKSDKDELLLSKGTFINNGQFHFTVQDNIEPVVDNVPYSFVNRQSTNNKKESPIGWQKTVAVGTASTGLIAVAASVVLYALQNKYGEEYQKETRLSEMDRLIQKQERVLTGSVACGIAGGIMLPAGVALYLWDRFADKKKPKAVALRIGTQTGLQFAVTF